MHGLPVTIRLPNCGKSPDMNVQRPAIFQPPTMAVAALDASGSNILPFPIGNSHVPVTIRLPNCGKSPDMNVQRPAIFQPPTMAVAALDASGSNILPFPIGNSHVPAMLN